MDWDRWGEEWDRWDEEWHRWRGDHDGDTFSDGEEVAAGTDPNDPTSHPPVPIHDEVWSPSPAGWGEGDWTRDGVVICTTFPGDVPTFRIRFG